MVTWHPAMTAGVGVVDPPDGEVGDALLPHAANNTVALNKMAQKDLVTTHWTACAARTLHQNVMSAICRM